MYSVDDIHKRMLDSIGDYENNSFPTSDITRAVAVAAKDIYDKAEEIKEKFNVDNYKDD